VARLESECSRFSLELEITAKVTRSGYRIHEVPIPYAPRAGGRKLSARKDGLPALPALLRYRTWLPRAQRAPGLQPAASGLRFEAAAQIEPSPLAGDARVAALLASAEHR
jgi:hypothetical protein